MGVSITRMGAINFSIDIELVKLLKELLPIKVFVETGTYEGDTIDVVQSYFEAIYSVEIFPAYYEKARQRFSEGKNIYLYQNNSPDFIKEIKSQIQDSSCLYWLDAHWCATEGDQLQASQCPLIEEIQSIDVLNNNSVILIDDARLFLCPPPKPHIIDQWPRFSSILRELQNISDNHEILILNDVILYIPLSISSELNLYAHHHGVDWLIIKHQSMNREKLLNQINEKEDEIVSLSGSIETLLRQLQEKDKEILSLAEIADERNFLLQTVSTEAGARLNTIDSLSEQISLLSKENLTLSERVLELRNELENTFDFKIRRRFKKGL